MKITYERIRKAQDELVGHWGGKGKRVIEEAFITTPFNETFEDFLDNCEAMGGDWGNMLLSGIHKLYPKVWDAIPDDMGVFAFTDICNVLILCGVVID